MTSHERTGWRDEAISRRHREWGLGCPAVDLDFVLVEFGLGQPVAIVEYKHHAARAWSADQPTMRALVRLADAAGIPCFVARYWPDSWAFHVVPLNASGRAIYGVSMTLTERHYVESLYMLRQRAVDEHVLAHLHDAYPPQRERRSLATVGKRTG